MSFDRRSFLQYFTATGLSSTLFPGALYAVHQRQGEGRDEESPLTPAMIEQAEKIAGLSFTPAERELMIEELNERLADYEAMREESLPNDIPPALQFDLGVAGTRAPSGDIRRLTAWEPPVAQRPTNDEDLAFLPVSHLASLIKSRQVTSTELTELYLNRLNQYDGTLQTVVTLTEERAMNRARQADKELAGGVWRGPLHGIPWGAKDLLAVEGYPTTWGAMPYKDQVIDEDAFVVRRLDAAGAVLIAKLTLGALAWGDVWFGGTTKNPWNIEQGSSGSSAGPGSAVAAGLVGFAIGSETLGSIVSPSTRNAVSGLRPTYGRVSRAGAMALSWSMDKLGPMCRSAEDCALVFDAIHGANPDDASSVDAPFDWAPRVDVSTLRVGYLSYMDEDADYAGKSADRAVLDVLRNAGLQLKPFSLPERSAGPLLLTLSVEAAAAFDDITRSGEVNTMVRQIANAWPNVFRAARFVPAVEYVQANRHRTLLMREMEETMKEVDVFVAPSFRGGALQVTNLTGHPCVVVPNRFDALEDRPDSPRRSPGSISFIGGLYKDDATLAVAHLYQQHTDFHLRRPPIG